MKAAGRIAVIIPLCMLAGCQHKVQATPPADAQARVYPPNSVAANAPPPQVPPPETANVKGPPEPTQQPPPPKVKQTKRHKAKPTETAPSTKDSPAQGTVQQASTTESPDSPIGQLSSAGDRSGVPSRETIKHQIEETDSNLKGVVTKRTLTQDEQLTKTQIETFLTKARHALEQDDLDGANTLVTKAKVLLEELTTKS